MSSQQLKVQALHIGLTSIASRITTYTRYLTSKKTVPDLIKFLRENIELRHLPDIALIFVRWITGHPKDGYDNVFTMPDKLRDNVFDYINGFYKICPTELELSAVESYLNPEISIDNFSNQ